jgi:hypothetical protein
MTIKTLMIAFLLLIHFTGCMLFKKSSKATLQNRSDSNSQSYLERVSLKTANKETNIYTYWNDSLIFQFQNIRENVDEAKLSVLSNKENQVTKQEQTIKKAEPPDLWLYGVVAILVAVVLFRLHRYTS